MMRKFSEIQEKGETQSKESSKIIQELKDKIAIFKKNQSELGLKSSLQEFDNTMESMNSRIGQAEEIISGLEH